MLFGGDIELNRSITALCRTLTLAQPTWVDATFSGFSTIAKNAVVQRRKIFNGLWNISLHIFFENFM